MAFIRSLAGDSANKIKKKTEITKLLVECGKLKTLYPEFIGAISKWEVEIIPQTPLKRQQLDFLQQNFQDFQKKLAEDKAIIDNKLAQEKIEAERKAAQAKIYSETLTLEAAKIRLFKYTDIPDRIVSSEPWKIFQDLLKMSEPPVLENFQEFSRYQLSLFTQSVINFYNLAREIKIDSMSINKKIIDLSSSTEESQLVLLAQEYKKRIQPKLEMLDKYIGILALQKEYFIALKRAEDKIEKGFFSDFTDAKKILQDELFIQPDGHYVNKANCKLDDEKKSAPTTKALSPDIENKKTYDLFKASRLEILDNILKLDIPHQSSETKETKPNILALIEHHAQNAVKISQMLEDHSQYVKTKNAIKTSLKLDKNIRENLEFWTIKTDKGWHGHGGCKIKLDEKEFRAPARIYKMMCILDKDHINKTTFLSELNQARTKPANFISAHFLFATGARSLAASRIYASKNIEEETLNEIKITPL